MKKGAGPSKQRSRLESPASGKAKSPKSEQKSPASVLPTGGKKKNKGGDGGRKGGGNQPEWKVKEFEAAVDPEEENRLRLEIQQLFTKAGFKSAEIEKIESQTMDLDEDDDAAEEEIVWDEEIEWDEEVEEDGWEEEAVDDDFDLEEEDGGDIPPEEPAEEEGESEEEEESEGEEEEEEGEDDDANMKQVPGGQQQARGPLAEALDALEASLVRTNQVLAEQEKRGDLRKVAGMKLSMAQKEAFLGRMAKLSLHTVKTIDKALQLKEDVHRSIVDKHGLPKTPSELMPPCEDALDVLFQDLRQDTESQGFVENEEKWVQSGLWYRVTKESQKAWMVYASATGQLPKLDEVSKRKGKDEDEPTFDQVYMQQITEALADELDELKDREKIEEDETKIAQLVDCLQLGMDFYTDLEKDLCVQGWKRKNNNNNNTKNSEGKGPKGLHRALQELY